jgi:hypothetical protein
MKSLAKIIFLMLVCLLCGTAISAQQSSATVKKVYKNIQIEKFTIKQGVEFPAENIDKIAQDMLRAFVKSKKFSQVSMDSEKTATASPEVAAADVPTLKVSGEIILFNKGSQGGRYLLGPFGGQKYATRIVATVKFTDVKTGETVLDQSVDGIVTGGFFGGDKDGANNGLSNEVVKLAKKNFTENGK